MKHTVEEVSLSSGAKGLLIDVPGATVTNLRFQFRAGLRFARRPNVYEIAHVVEHLAFGANAKFRSEQEFEADFTKNGAYHNAWTSDFSVCYESECADFEWDRIMELQQIAIAEPRFNEEELRSEKGNVRAELTGYMNDYNRLLWPKLQQVIGEDIPDLQERLKTISNITLRDIREHYRRTHTAQNLRFVIAGDLHRRKRRILRMLEEWQLRSGERFTIPEDDLHAAAPVLIRRKDASNITFGFAWVTPHQLSPDQACAMNCLNHILSGTTSSRIFGKARQQGLVYSMGSDLSNGPHNASWDFEGEVNLENASPLFELIHAEINQVLNGNLSDEDLAAAKSYALGRYQMGAQTVSQISDFYSDNYFTSGLIEKYDNAPAVIKHIQKSTMVELAREFIGQNIDALVAVGSVEKSVITALAGFLRF